MRVIGFAGLARAGKTTATDEVCQWALANNGKFDPVRVHFAGPLKEAMRAMGAEKGGPRDELYRLGCQHIGTQVFRNPDFLPGLTGPDYWCDLLSIKLTALAAEEDQRLSALEKGPLFRETLVLIDDVRFPNEVETLRTWQAHIIFVDAYRRMVPTMSDPWRKHISEQLANEYTFGHIPDETFDCMLTNNESEASFRRMVRSMAPSWSGLTAKGSIDG